VHAIIHGKIASKYQGNEVEAMKAVANAYQNRSLKDFEAALVKFKNGTFVVSYNVELGMDAFIRSHFNALYDTLMEQNLLRIIEPYTRVEIAHVAKLIQLPTAQVEKKYGLCFD
jgi:26S proteasome regulatory subunit N6